MAHGPFVANFPGLSVPIEKSVPVMVSWLDHLFGVMLNSNEKSFKYLKWQWRIQMCKCLVLFIQSSSIIIPSCCNHLTSKLSSSGIHCTSSCSSSSCQNESFQWRGGSIFVGVILADLHPPIASNILYNLIISLTYRSQVPEYQTKDANLGGHIPPTSHSSAS